MSQQKEHNLYLLAIDLGATSGRSILTNIHNNVVTMELLTRFPNEIKKNETTYYWDIQSLFEEIKRALTLIASRKITLSSIGIDTWGVDFVYLDNKNQLLANPRAYRDPYTDGAPEKFFANEINRETVYQKTGIQVMNFNSLFQLYAAKNEQYPPYLNADSFLFMPDALSFLLTGKKVCEYSILSTSQLLNVHTQEPDEELLKAVGFSKKQLPKMVMPGTVIGTLLPEIAAETGVGEVPVIAIAGHDTASAIAAIPTLDREYAYLSSGTWSLMGIELTAPIVTVQTAQLNFTNEGGVDGTTRFLKNITGMWLLEECIKEWSAAGKEYSYPQLVAMAEKSTFSSRINPDHASFAAPKSMTKAITAYCEMENQPIPASDADFVSCIMNSLAAKYKEVLDILQSLAPFEIKRLHVIGGGSQNDYLNQLTANAIGLPVVAGPSEATGFGNIMMQAKALGIFDTLQQMRAAIAATIETKTFLPHPPTKE